jgi:carbonic anhydrase/acetyltransferase-like protein (isoleucine patch superfamily)
VIGADSVIAAHAWSALPNGKLIYVSAPVKIGSRVTIGASSIVNYGCVIGDDSLIEPMSYVAPMTEVPPGEIWGGAPAIFQRKRGRTGKAEQAEGVGQ